LRGPGAQNQTAAGRESNRGFFSFDDSEAFEISTLGQARPKRVAENVADLKCLPRQQQQQQPDFFVVRTHSEIIFCGQFFLRFFEKNNRVLFFFK
jgi:hypothetical protein